MPRRRKSTGGAPTTARSLPASPLKKDEIKGRSDEGGPSDEDALREARQWQWQHLCSAEELSLEHTLACGQAFGWIEHSSLPGLWSGVVYGRLFSLVHGNTLQLHGSEEAATERGGVAVETEVNDVFFTEHGASPPCKRAVSASGRAVKKEHGGSEARLVLSSYFRLSAAHALPDLISLWSGSKPPTYKAMKRERENECFTSTGSGRSKRRKVQENDVFTEVGSSDASETPDAPKTGRGVHSLRACLAEAAKHVHGLRILRQPPVDCTFSFICSQNNHISRITSMIRHLTHTYGVPLGEVLGTPFYAFPSVEALAAASETDLRDNGFGYRAKYIAKAAKHIAMRSKEVELSGEVLAALHGVGAVDAPSAAWLYALRGNSDTDEVREALKELSGVGPKVADCIALFALDQLDLIPVDTHVRQIAERHVPSLKGKNMSPVIYQRIRGLFSEAFSPYPGWAHSVLFAAELPRFQKHST